LDGKLWWIDKWLIGRHYTFSLYHGLFPIGFSRTEVFNGNGMEENLRIFFLKDMFWANRRSGRHLDRGSSVMSELQPEPQARKLLPMNGRRPDADSAFLSIYTHILYLVVGSSSNVLSSTRTRTSTQLGPSLVIVISLALFLPIPYILTVFP